MRLTAEMGGEGGGTHEAISWSWNVRCSHDARWDTNNLLSFLLSTHYSPDVWQFRQGHQNWRQDIRCGAGWEITASFFETVLIIFADNDDSFPSPSNISSRELFGGILGL